MFPASARQDGQAKRAWQEPAENQKNSSAPISRIFCFFGIVYHKYFCIFPFLLNLIFFRRFRRVWVVLHRKALMCWRIRLSAPCQRLMTNGIHPQVGQAWEVVGEDFFKLQHSLSLPQVSTLMPLRASTRMCNYRVEHADGFVFRVNCSKRETEANIHVHSSHTHTP